MPDAAPDAIHHLPLPPTPLLGRAAEMATARALLAAGARLLTLTGPPGVGKTRLAIEVAAGALDAFPDGACFVDLAPLTDPALVLPAVARAVGARAAEGRPLSEAVALAIGERRLLLLLDNVEHLLAAAPEIEALLVAAPGLTVLATSREPLGLRREQTFPVPPLALPDLGAGPDPEATARVAAVDLFVQRARAVAPGFALTPENAAAVAAICVRLDGLPLAIEIAAARAAILPPAALLDRLENRLPLPAWGARDLPARHRTVRAAVGWSHDLLPEEERVLLRRLGVFAGGFTLKAAAAVGGEGGPPPDVLDGVTALADKGLLRPLGLVGGEPRFGMLETVREFALERLAADDDPEAARSRHAAFFQALAEAAQRGFRGAELGPWLARLDRELDNLRAALGWAIGEGRAEPALRLAASLAGYWTERELLREGEGWLERAVALPGADPIHRARAVAALGWYALDLGDHARARDLIERGLTAVRAAGDDPTVVKLLSNLGRVATEAGDYARARRLLGESLALAQHLGDAWMVAWASLNLGRLAHAEGSIDDAWDLQQEALTFFNLYGARDGVADALVNLGEIAASRGDRAASRDLLDRGLAMFERLDARRGLGFALYTAGRVARGRGDRREAAAAYARMLALARRTGERRNRAEAIAGLAPVAPPGEATARLGGAAERLREAVGYDQPPNERGPTAAAHAAARAALGAAAFAAELAAGRAMTTEAAVAEAETVAAAIAAAETPSPPAAAADDPLTEREREVLRLVVEGHSNKAIADRLALSPRTVEHHLTAIYAKLGVSSRTAAARAATRLGLA